MCADEQSYSYCKLCASKDAKEHHVKAGGLWMREQKSSSARSRPGGIPLRNKQQLIFGNRQKVRPHCSN